MIENVDERDLCRFRRGFDLTSPTVVEHVSNFAGSVMTNTGTTGKVQRLKTLRIGRARNPSTEAESVAFTFAWNPTYAGTADQLEALNGQADVRASDHLPSEHLEADLAVIRNPSVIDHCGLYVAMTDDTRRQATHCLLMTSKC